MIMSIHHKINIPDSDFSKITVFGEIPPLSSRLNLDERDRHARSVHLMLNEFFDIVTVPV